MRDIVCVHAAASRPATWERVRAGLAGLGFELHTPALLGHAGRRGPYRGLTPQTFRDDLIRQLDAAGLARCTLVGSSFGAFIASLVAQREPERVERLVLEEIPVPPASDRDAPAARRHLPLPLVTIGTAVRRPGCRPAVARNIIKELRKPQPDWWDGLSRITMPTLIIAGGNTSHLDQSRFGLLTDALPNARTATVAVGHRVHTRAPHPWLRVVGDFIAQAD